MKEIAFQLQQLVMCQDKEIHTKYKQIVFDSDNSIERCDDDVTLPYFKMVAILQEKMVNAMGHYEEILSEKDDSIKFFQGRVKRLTDELDRLKKTLSEVSESNA